MSAKNFSMPSALPEVEIIPVIRDVRQARVHIPDSRTVLLIGSSDDQIQRLLNAKFDWIKRNVQRLKEEEGEVNKIEKITLFGSVIGNEDFDGASLAELRKSFRSALKAYGQAYLSRKCRNPPRLRPWRMKKIGAYSVKYDEIHLSVYTAMLPKNLIEYAVFHELSHRKVRNHGKAFWKLIRAEFPDYKNKDTQLRVWWARVQKLISKNRILARI